MVEIGTYYNQTNAPDSGSGARGQQNQSVSQAQKLKYQSTSGDAAGKVSKKEEKSQMKDIESAVETLNESLSSINVKREFKVEEQLNEVIVKLIDKDEDKIIKQIPSEEAIRLSKNIKEMVGLIYDETF
ncbi:flagellar protein FlaG [Limisalsivibrio acetivorans]|uniref:flagellar protein FlaG n=1 Tax=Limisalsivibrio acetivorans TaxID=1304888 RepID=UPI0003B69761|nr:flagellar protein FlaG [Limisalsivibrio acetivorans]